MDKVVELSLTEATVTVLRSWRKLVTLDLVKLLS